MHQYAEIVLRSVSQLENFFILGMKVGVTRLVVNNFKVKLPWMPMGRKQKHKNMQCI